MPCRVTRARSRGPRAPARRSARSGRGRRRSASPRKRRAQRPRRAGVGAEPAGSEREHLDLDVRTAAAAPRPGRGRSSRAPGRSGLGYMLVTISARTLSATNFGDSRRIVRSRSPKFAPPSALAPSASMPASAHQPVAVFDSGVGGLTVLHELLVSLPTEDYLYLGDTARFPYGERTQDELRRFAVEIAEHLLDAGPSCSSSPATRPARRRWTRSSAISQATAPGRRRDRRDRAGHPARGGGSRTGRIGLLATPATVASGAYEQRGARRRPPRPPRERRLPGPGADHPGRLPVRRAGCRDRARLLRAAARGRGRHGDPRLHPLPAGRADAPADARARRHARHLGRRRGAQRRARAGRAWPAQPADAARAATASGAPATSSRSGRSAPAFCRCRSARSSTSSSTRSVVAPMSRAAAQLRPRARTSCARPRSSPGFVRTATGSALISMGETRVICTASVQESVPRWLAGSGRGWVTAEYGMLPASTGERKQRDVSQGRARRAHGRDPAPDRPLAARRGRLRGARRAHDLRRLRRAPGRRRHALRVDHRRHGRAAPGLRAA